MRVFAILFAVAPLLSGCTSIGTLPPLERADVECAVKALSNAEGVRKVEVETGLGATPLIIRYDTSARDGMRHGSRIRIDEWAAPGQPLGYDFQIVDDSGIQGIRDLMSQCFQGMTVVTD